MCWSPTMTVDLYIFSPLIQFCCVIGTDKFRIVLSSWLVSLLFLCSNLLSLSAIPDSSVGKESTCSAGDSGLIPGSGRSAREGICYPLHYSWASLVAQMVKRLPAMWETRVWFLDGEDPLEKEMAVHSSTLAWKIPWTEEPDRLHTVHGVTKSRTGLSDFTFTFQYS